MRFRDFDIHADRIGYDTHSTSFQGNQSSRKRTQRAQKKLKLSSALLFKSLCSLRSFVANKSLSP